MSLNPFALEDKHLATRADNVAASPDKTAEGITNATRAAAASRHN